MMTPAWFVCAWPPVLWQVASAPPPHFVHLGTHVVSPNDTTAPSAGQTLWGDATGSSSAGVAWDWVALQEGVVAMADPLGVVTNLRLLDIHGDALSPQAAALQLNELVHGLPWQSEVCRVLREPDADGDLHRG